MIIKDMGYFNPQSFIELSNKQAYYLSRWKSNIEMYVKDQNDNFFLFDIDKFLTKIDNIVEIDIYIKKERQYSKARLIIEPVPDEVKNIRLRKLNTESKRRGRKTKDRTKLFCCYNIYVSNIPNKLLLMSNFRNLYRIRWQIELVFKNWKSNFNLDKLSGVKLERIKCMIYSRLLLIFISRKIIYQLKTIYWIDKKVEISEFKASKHMIIVFSEILKLSIKKQSHEISKLLNDAIKFIGKKCTKLKQSSRFNSLDIITSIS